MRFPECPPNLSQVDDVNESDVFNDDPLLWLRTSYPHAHSLPTHLVLFDVMEKVKVQTNLASKQTYFNADVVFCFVLFFISCRRSQHFCMKTTTQKQSIYFTLIFPRVELEEEFLFMKGSDNHRIMFDFMHWMSKKVFKDFMHK